MRPVRQWDMAWDPTRTVPWGRLVREWLVYVAVMSVVFVVFLRDQVSVGSVVGLLMSFPMYLLAGFVLAKFGYQRKTLRDLRSTAVPETPRPTTPRRPARTSRTSTGPSQHRPDNKRKRR